MLIWKEVVNPHYVTFAMSDDITDGLIFVGSETGMVHVDELTIDEKGRLGPGDIIGVNLKEGRLYRDRELKDRLASRAPYEAVSYTHLRAHET